MFIEWNVYYYYLCTQYNSYVSDLWTGSSKKEKLQGYSDVLGDTGHSVRIHCEQVVDTRKSHILVAGNLERKGVAILVCDGQWNAPLVGVDRVGDSRRANKGKCMILVGVHLHIDGIACLGTVRIALDHGSGGQVATAVVQVGRS